jgi:FHA domain
MTIPPGRLFTRGKVVHLSCPNCLIPFKVDRIRVNVVRCPSCRLSLVLNNLAPTGSTAPFTTMSGPEPNEYPGGVLPLLVICGIPPTHWAYRIRPGNQILGRRPECDIAIDCRSLSCRHAAITSDGTTHEIRDLRTAGGTYVNGDRVDQRVLRVGDLIRVGGLTLELVKGSDGTEAQL